MSSSSPRKSHNWARSPADAVQCLSRKGGVRTYRWWIIDAAALVSLRLGTGGGGRPRDIPLDIRPSCARSLMIRCT